MTEKIVFPKDEPIGLVNLDTREITFDKPKSNVTSIQEAFLLRWAKRILKGDYKITYLEGESNGSTD